MKKEHYLYLGIGGLLLLLLLRKKSPSCPSSTVMNWASLAQKSSNRFKHLTPYEILAIIHDQSGGNPNQIYYIGGVWRRYGLMGVPLAWAQEVGFRGDTKELLKPETNIEYGSKILFFMDAKIRQLFYWVPFAKRGAGISSHTYSWYVHGQSLYPKTAMDPILEMNNRIIELSDCYWRVT